MNNAISTLYDAAEEYVAKENKKGRIPSDHSICDYLDHVLERYERINGNCLNADNFESICDEICKKYIDKEQAYIRGDTQSYRSIVLNKNLISTCEHYMIKTLTDTKKQMLRYKPIYVDTEFPIDDTGRYIITD